MNEIDGDKDPIRSLIQSRDFLTACGLLKSRLKHDWDQMLSDAFVGPQYEPSEAHQAIFELDSRIVITPNFDKIYDVHAQQESGQTVRISHYYDPDTPQIMRGGYRGILKVHGTIDQPSTTIFTRKDYSTLRYKYASFQSLIDALFLTHTFLFLGTSLDDPDLRLFLENHACAHPSAPVHFMTTPSGEIDQSRDISISDDLNIELLRYDSANGHAELTESLKDLVTLVQSRREEIADRQEW
ncbi:SIR2 family protein [Brevibacterium sp. NPDC059310]|uniref:SIR2 family protein n=1 Tax=Brevibacterium sp. NPDC059310 TaxID=3346802 RepID=UPI00366DE49A